MKHLKSYEQSTEDDLKPKFNVSDKIICINDKPNDKINNLELKNGEEYEIIKINKISNSFLLIIKNSKGKLLKYNDHQGFNQNRFITPLKYNLNKYNL